MPISEAKRKANNKFDKKTYTMIGCKVRKDAAAEFKAVCADAGTTPNAVFRAAMDDFMATHGKADAGGC